MSAHHPSEKSADQGWLAMREILDREMPDRRKRRGIIWWWPLGVAAGLALWFWLGGSPSRGAVASLPEPGVAVEAGTTEASGAGASGGLASNEIGDHPVRTAGSDLPAKAPDEGQGKVLTQYPSPVAKSGSKGLGMGQGEASKEYREDWIVGMNIPGAFENSGEATDRVDEVMESGLTTDPVTSVLSAIEPSIRMDRAQVEIADPLEDAIDPLPLPERSTMMEAAAVLHRRPAAYPAGLSLFATVGTYAGTTKGLGHQAGLGGGWQVLPRLSLRTAVERHWTNLDAALPGSAQDREFVNADSPIVSDPLGQGNVVIPEGNLSNASRASDLTPLVSTVRHWRWNAGAQYRITPWLAAEMGGGLDWGIRAYTRYPIIPGTGTPQDISEGNSLLNDYGLVKNSTAIAYGGIAWTPLRWLEVYGRYTHAFSPYLDVSGTGITSEKKDRTDKLGSIQVGVRAVIRP